MRIALLTAVYGNVDEIKPVRQQNINNYELFCFTDTPKTEIQTAEEYTGTKDYQDWRVINWTPPIPKVKASRKNALYAKYIKTQSHQLQKKIGKFDCFVWVDGSVFITGEGFLQFMMKRMKRGFVVYRHPWRKCVYAEAQRGMQIKKYARENIAGQVKYYKQHGYPINEGLYMNTVFARKNDRRINEAMDLWWDHNVRFSFKDQVSLPYALWRKKVRPDVIDRDAYVATQFEKREHRQGFARMKRDRSKIKVTKDGFNVATKRVE